MTPASLLHFTQALLWCVLLFVSIAGYGAALLRIFNVRRPSAALAGISGVGVVIFLGGCLNLVKAISEPFLLALILLGILAAILLQVTPAETEGNFKDTIPQPPSSRAAALLLLVVAVIFALRLGASVHAGEYQASDDYNYYLGAPIKMFQLHYYAADPFSERRIAASLGGNYFLQTLVLTALAIENVQMADRTLGLILLAFVSFGLARIFRLTPLQRAVFVFLVFFTPQIQFNLTSVLLPSALFFGLVYVAANRRLLDEKLLTSALIIGITVGAVATMKSTYLPHGVIFVCAVALFRWRRSSFAAGAKVFLYSALGAFIVMAPWMIANHTASGTFLFPTLGLGYHYSAYGLYPGPSGAGIHVVLHKVLPFSIPLCLLFLIEWAISNRDEQGEAILSLSFAAFVAAVLVGIATGGDSVRRYNYPCMLPAIVLLYVVFSRRANTSSQPSRWRILQVCSVALTVLIALDIWRSKFSNELLQIPQSLSSSLHDTPILPPSVQAEYAAMQRSLPTDSAALATVNDTYLLDFRAHDIKIADFPGTASLPPGWPSRQDGEALARYLLANHIRYLICSYADFVGLDHEAVKVLHDPSRTQWIKSEQAITLRSHQQYTELARTRRHLYDDGQIYILDLAETQ